VHWPRGPAHDTAIFDAGQLQPGAATTGPAIVEALDTTIVVPPGWGFRVDEHGNGRLEASE
jgi:N-methylhydantoinase A/oxoprolinase/acetone carboxylase beta subunit